jgi:S1-C subfamily serine protease
MHGSAAAQALTPEKLFENLSRSVWYVWGIDGQEKRLTLGSGVVVGSGKVVTNCHVIEKIRTIYVQRENGCFPPRASRRR